VSGTVAVSNFPATQPVSAAALPLPSGAATSAKQPALGVSGTPSTDVLSVQGVAGGTPQPVSGTVAVSNFPATQPISGTVTSNIGTTGGLALDATLTGGTQKSKLVDTGGTNVASVSAAGALKVDGSAVTQPVSGTFFQGTQPISAAALPLPAGASTSAKQPALGVAGTPSTDVITVQGAATGTAMPVSGTVAVSNFPAAQTVAGSVSVSNFPGTQAVSGTFFQATQPVSAAALPLPSGASTAAKQPALGTAGSASADVISVQGVASMTALKVDGSGVTQPISGAVSVSNFPATQPVSGTVTANAGTGNFTVVQATGTNLHAVVDSGSITATQATAANLNATVVGSGNFTVVQATGTNLHTVVDSGTVTAVTAITNALPTGANTLGSVKLTDGTTVPGVIAATTALKTDLSSVAGTATVVSAAGIQKVGISGNAGASVDTTISSGAAPTNVVYTTNAPTSVAAGAYTVKFQNASGAAVSVKASAGNLYVFSITNETAAVAYIEFFNTAATPTLGTTAVVFAVKLPASANVTISPGAIALQNFTTGIGFAVTTTENGTTAASVTGMIFYQ